MTIVAAIVGFAICLITVNLGNKIGNRLVRYAVMLLGIILGFGAAGALAPNPAAGQTAGMIVFGLAVVYAIVFRRKQPPKA